MPMWATGEGAGGMASCCVGDVAPVNWNPAAAGRLALRPDLRYRNAVPRSSR
jgi:hypothetical protein